MASDDNSKSERDDTSSVPSEKESEGEFEEDYEYVSDEIVDRTDEEFLSARTTLQEFIKNQRKTLEYSMNTFKPKEKSYADAASPGDQEGPTPDEL